MIHVKTAILPVAFLFAICFNRWGFYDWLTQGETDVP